MPDICAVKYVFRLFPDGVNEPEWIFLAREIMKRSLSNVPFCDEKLLPTRNFQAVKIKASSERRALVAIERSQNIVSSPGSAKLSNRLALTVFMSMQALIYPMANAQEAAGWRGDRINFCIR